MQRADNVYNDDELLSIQKIEKSILEDVANICDSYNIEYFLLGGTLLGAIRHNGFIPWDDDIDIGMTRTNYIKFLEVAPKALPSHLHIETPYNNPSFPYMYTKIRKDDTMFMEYCNRQNTKMHHGIYIDIFPIDRTADDIKESYEQFKKYRRLVRLFDLRQVKDISKPPTSLLQKVKSAMRQTIYFIFHLIPYRFLVNNIDKVAMKYINAECENFTLLDFPRFKKIYFSKQELYPLKKHIFNGAYYNVPNDYDSILTRQYGEYMKYPAPEMRFGHKPFMIKLE